jgi:predicted GNAT superfamily acetyltransferase
MSERSVSVRILTTLDEFREAETVQYRAWAMDDPNDVIPLHVLLTAQKNGGLTAGAFSASGEMIGLLFGFLGLTGEGKIKHCSHLMGILPDVRRQGVGRQLKLFQRQYVLAQGFDLVTWTFDPLEGVNASLNIARLGGIAHTYYDNLYGDNLPDGLNSGLRTDRFEVEWWIASPRVRQFVDSERVRPGYPAVLDAGARLVNDVQPGAGGLLMPVSMTADADAETLLVEVPPEFQAIRARSMDAARSWREHTGTLFKHYFARGYTVSDFISSRDDPRRRNFYVLAHRVDGLSK